MEKNTLCQSSIISIIFKSSLYGSDLMLTPLDWLHLDCPQTIAPFHGKHGKIIRGHVSPPLEGVTITLSSEQIGTITVITNKDGIYRYSYCCCAVYTVFTLCCHSYGPILSDLTVTVVCFVHLIKCIIYHHYTATIYVDCF